MRLTVKHLKLVGIKEFKYQYMSDGQLLWRIFKIFLQNSSMLFNLSTRQNDIAITWMFVRHTCFHKELLTWVKFSGLMIISNEENLTTRSLSPKRIEVQETILNMWILFPWIYATQSRTDPIAEGKDEFLK